MSFIPCDKCIDGFIYINDDTAFKCKCLKKYHHDKKMTNLLKKANIPVYFSSESDNTIIDYKISSYKGKDENGNLIKITKFIDDFEKYKRRNLYFNGGVGTQKSTLMRYIGKELLDKGYSVYYTLADTLIKDLQDADRNEELKEKWNRIINYDILLIDEMSEDKITTYKSGWQNKFLLPFLKTRIELSRKSIIFASNSPIENIGDFFKGAIQDLIYREVADKDMIFKDNYSHVANDFDVKDLWN